jgi:RHS repeat-associated protein
VLISASSPSGNLFSLCYDFHIGGGVNLPPCVFSGTTAAGNGNVFQVVNNRDQNRNQTFSYDSLNRIQTAYTNGPNWGESFGSATAAGGVPSTAGIDPWGNLWQRSQITGKTNYEPLSCPANTKNQLTTCSLSYDAAGNLTANGTAAYTYDAENRLISAGAYTYTYDGDGYRVKKTNGSTGTLYYFDANGNVLNESSLGATNLREYVYLGSKRIARIDVPTPLTVKYYFSDYLGSTSVIADSNGSIPVLEESDYYPFGGEISVINNDSNGYKFTGKERDAESSLDFFEARHYGSSLGRFMQPDPSGLLAQRPSYPQSWNLYAYTMNNPLVFIDPTGLDCVYANDTGNGVESIDHHSNSGECGKNGGSWAPGYVDENWAHFNESTGMFQVGSINGSGNNSTVDYTMFEAGAQTQFNGNESSCLTGCAGFSLANANWLQKQLVANSKVDGLDGYIQFLAGREEQLHGGFLIRLAAGPLDPSTDHWAGPGGMGPPGGRGDWAASVHDYNFSTNGITMGSYFNPTLSIAASKALIQSNSNLMRNAGGIQGVKMRLSFGVTNAFQWYANSWK